MFKYTYIDAINISIIIKCRIRKKEKEREKSFYTSVFRHKMFPSKEHRKKLCHTIEHLERRLIGHNAYWPVENKAL